MTAFNHTTFRATHNSYTGNLKGGARGSIYQQLAGGVRLIELDLHGDHYLANGDYEVGHDGGPGDQTMHGDGGLNANPATNAFSDWLAVMTNWCRLNANHAPVQLLLDFKNTLSADSAAQGNHGALNRRLQQVFGAALLTAESVGAWPDVSNLRGRVLVVLSGDMTSRVAYVTDKGANPAVSVNGRGVVVEVHESEAGNHSLWYWIGLQGADGRIVWKSHGHYGTGTTPSVAVNDAGWVVEVHKSQDKTRLWYQVGRVTANLDIEWGQSHDYDNGVLPTIQFASPASDVLREIHRSEAHPQNWDWRVTLNEENRSLSFTGNAKTNDPLWTKTRSGQVEVGQKPDSTLIYSTASVRQAPIQFEQVAFVEYQSGDAASIQQVARFAASKATPDAEPFLVNALSAGLVTRGWEYPQGYPALYPPLTYAATDQPYSSWYDQYCVGVGTVI
jgi:hypothetical protein